jgi:hypothetical protein
LAVMGRLPSSILPSEACFAHVASAFRLAEFYVPFVDHTPVFSLLENAIAKEPGSSYPARWRCAS